MLFCILLAAVLATQAPALTGGFLWDDGSNIIGNPAVTSKGGLLVTWLKPGETSQYYPLTFTVFWLLYHVFGLHTLGYHLATAALHAANATLLGLLLDRLRMRGAWLAALLFAIHPVQVMSVAWMTELKNTLSGLFYLTALLAYVRWAGSPAGRSPGATRGWPGIVMLFMLAMLGKASAASLPVAAALITWWRTGRVGRRELALLAPMLALGLAVAAVPSSIEAEIQGPTAAAAPFDALNRVLYAGHAFWFYLGKLAWPADQAFIYPAWTPGPAAWFFPLSAAALLLALLLLSPRIGRGPFVALALFAGQAPALILWKVLYMFRFTTVSDHWLYLACIGPLAMAAAGLALLRRRYLVPVSAAVMLALGIRSWTYAHTFRNIEVLWRHTIALNPACWMAHNNLGQVLLGTGRPDEAAHHFREAIAHKPDLAEAHMNLGIHAGRAGRHDEAVEHFQRAVEAAPQNFDARALLARALASLKDPERAEREWREAVRLKPDSTMAHMELAALLASRGRRADAIATLGATERMPISDAALQETAGRLWLFLDRPDLARARFAAALELKPSLHEPHYQLGLLDEDEGRVADALQHYRRAIELQPGLLKAWLQAARLYAVSPDPAYLDPARAVELANHAVTATSGRDPAALFTLGLAQRAAGDASRAMESASRALDLLDGAEAGDAAEPIMALIKELEAGIEARRPATE